MTERDTRFARATSIIMQAPSLGAPGATIASVPRTYCIVITFAKERRYATFECDEDGDVVLTMSDRTQDVEAEACMVELGQEESAIRRAVRFIGG